MSSWLETRINKIQDVIGTDAGNRGMKELIVPNDLIMAGKIFGSLDADSTIVILSGFPCCVNENPPTETDGPPGTLAIARAGLVLGYKVYIITDDCNKVVFAAACEELMQEYATQLSLETFPDTLSDNDEERYKKIVKECNLLIACERAGPGKDGNCYTMRGINMNEHKLIAPLHRFVQDCKSNNVQFLAIGDGGNELGMGKVINNIYASTKINNGELIGCVIPADYLIAASVSNWGGYALAASAALAKAASEEDDDDNNTLSVLIQKWINICLPTRQQEINLLQRCVNVGCRDGVSGQIESTVDGMSLETSLQCLDDIRTVALSTE